MPPSSNTSRALLLVALCFFTGATGLPQNARRPPAPSQLQDAARELSAGKLDEAEHDLESLLHSNPEEYRALDLLGVVRVLQHREAEAQSLFEQVVKAAPGFAAGHAHLGLLYLHLGRTQDALPELRQALRLDPGRA